VVAHGALGKYLQVAAPRPSPLGQSVFNALTMEQRAYYFQLIHKFAREAEERRRAQATLEVNMKNIVERLGQLAQVPFISQAYRVKEIDFAADHSRFGKRIFTVEEVDKII
jgi:hypothetical protein